MYAQVNRCTHNNLILPSFRQRRQGIAGEQGKRERDLWKVEKGLIRLSHLLLYICTRSPSPSPSSFPLPLTQARHVYRRHPFPSRRRHVMPLPKNRPGKLTRVVGSEREGACTCTPPRQILFFLQARLTWLVAACLLFVLSRSLLTVI